MGLGTNYNSFFKILINNIRHVDKEINTIFEIGSRDALDAITANRVFKPNSVHVFECNKTLLSTCKNNIDKYNNIFLCDKAVYGEDNLKLKFKFPTKLPGPTESWNGCGSLRGEVLKEYYESTNHLFKNLNKNNSSFDEVEVDTISLNTYCKNNNVDNIDLIMLDVEGVPLQILKTYDNIKNTKIIISEVYYKIIWEKGNDTFQEMENFLKDNFKCVYNEKKNTHFGNAMWVNKSIL